MAYAKVGKKTTLWLGSDDDELEDGHPAGMQGYGFDVHSEDNMVSVNGATEGGEEFEVFILRDLFPKIRAVMDRIDSRFTGEAGVPEKETWRTKSGRVLTAADIQALADEAERGYDISQIRAVRSREMGDEDEATPIEDLIEASSLGTPGAKSLRARTTPEEIAAMRKGMRNSADAANKAIIAKVAVDLMNAYNRGKKDPSDMATHGHDTMTGYEFYIETDGVVIHVALDRDLGS